MIQVFVKDNNVDQALRSLRKKMQREGTLLEMKDRTNYRKPSLVKQEEKKENIRRTRKADRLRRMEE
jgi:small subunit ribosomal protein S21